MIIDSHCHAGTGERLTAPWTTAAPIEVHIERAKEAGIDKTVVFPIHSTDYERANAETAEIVAAHSDDLVQYARLHPITDAGRIHRLLEIAVNDYHVWGLKIHAADALPTREVCQAAEDFGLPMLVDIMDQPGATEMMAVAFPNVNFIIAHLGSFAGHWMTHVQTIDQIARLPNVYADTSSVRLFDYLLDAIQRAGARKILFGTDGPLLHPALELERIKLLKLPAAEEALVTSQNLLRLTGRG